MTKKHYWDSCAFLAWLQNEAGREAACRDTLERARKGEILIVTSALTIAEVLWTKNGPRLGQDKAEKLNRFFKRSSIRVVNLNRKIAEASQKLVWNDGIAPKDSIHVATAIEYGCDVLETFDTDLLKASGKIAGMPIKEPEPATQGSLGI